MRFPLPGVTRAEAVAPVAAVSVRHTATLLPTVTVVPVGERPRKRKPKAFRVDGPGIAPTVPPWLRLEILERDFDAERGGWECPYCLRLVVSAADVHIDHVVARQGRWRRGGTVPSNLVAACSGCNASKGARPVTDSWLASRRAE